MKSSSQDNDMEMYSTHNKEIFVVAEKFISTSTNLQSTNT